MLPPLKLLEAPNGKSFRLLEAYHYLDAKSGVAFTIPCGWAVNLASFNIGPLYLRGETDTPSAIHDFLYGSRLVSRSVADRIFFRALRANGVRLLPALVCYLFVRTWGWRAYGKPLYLK